MKGCIQLYYIRISPRYLRFAQMECHSALMNICQLHYHWIQSWCQLVKLMTEMMIVKDLFW